MMDLTTLEGKDTPGKVRAMCAKAMTPLDGDADPARRRGVRVPEHGADAKQALAGSSVKVASVATAFPSGQSPLDVKLADGGARCERAPTRSTW